jgi:hypothetical protein
MLLCWVFFLCFFFLFLIRVLEFEAGEGDKKERKMKERQCSQAWRTLKRKQWCRERERERSGREYMRGFGHAMHESHGLKKLL